MRSHFERFARMNTRPKKNLKNCGIVLCDCGGTLSQQLDYKRLRLELAKLDEVLLVQRCSKFCQAASAQKLIHQLAARGCRRLVVAACPAENYERALAAAIAKTRIQPGLMAAAIIREHSAWTQPQGQQATTKALELVETALRRLAWQVPLKPKTRKINRRILILGSGAAALHAAGCLADLGHQVVLMTKTKQLGGCVEKFSHLHGYLDKNSQRAEQLLQEMLIAARQRVQSDRRINWICNAKMLSFNGEIGNFSVEFWAAGKTQKLLVGAVILALGSLLESQQPDQASQPISHLASLADALRLHNPTSAVAEPAQSWPRKTAIILDQHSEQGRAINALALTAAEQLAALPQRQVVLYCRHIRVAAWGMEALYRRVRAAGVAIFRYKEAPLIVATQKNDVVLRAFDHHSGREIEERFDRVVMADMALPAQPHQAPLSALRPGPEGAWQTDNPWLLSSKSNQPGIYVIGGARGNSELREALNDAAAAAGHIHLWMRSGKIQLKPDTPIVDIEKCVLCLTCLRACPHGAISINEQKEAAAIAAAACQRCGLCATLCPANAIEFPRRPDQELFAELADANQAITVFACENSAWPAANAAAAQRHQYAAKLRLVRVPCAGRVDERHVLSALENGASRVLILACHSENCRYIVGADHARQRIERLRHSLTQAGWDPNRVALEHLAEFEIERFLKFINQAQGKPYDR